MIKNTWFVDPEQLNPEQGPIIDLPSDKSYLIKGPPGSGKTNLLLLRANFLAIDRHPNLRIVVFTRMLQSFLVSGAEQYDFKASRITTLKRWEMDLLYEHGFRAKPPAEHDQQRRYYIERIQELIDAGEIAPNLYEVTLLDEAQDYLPEEVKVFRKLSKAIFAVADSRQKIYPTADCMAELEASVDETKELQYHHRCSIPICRLADALTKNPDYEPMEHTSNYDDARWPSSNPTYARVKSVEEEAKEIMSKLGHQIKAYPGELIGVVTPTNEDVQAIWSVIQGSSLTQFCVLRASDDDTPFDPAAPIWLATMHSFKGLEARALHIAGLAKLSHFPKQRNLIYTSVRECPVDRRK